MYFYLDLWILPISPSNYRTSSIVIGIYNGQLCAVYHASKFRLIFNYHVLLVKCVSFFTFERNSLFEFVWILVFGPHSSTSRSVENRDYCRNVDNTYLECDEHDNRQKKLIVNLKQMPLFNYFLLNRNHGRNHFAQFFSLTFLVSSGL